jgi:hypothetical protein
MKVSHEAPLAFLKLSEEWNDYQYALVHLLEKNSEYRDYFLNYRKQKGSYIVLDNSLHELGKPCSNDILLKWIEKLSPDEFIIPDVWEDTKATLDNAREWVNLKQKGVKFIPVVQANSYGEAKLCYSVYKDLGYEKIAFSYAASYYNEIFPHPNFDKSRALGRVYVINSLLSDGIIHKDDKIHLLGCSVPQEFSWYGPFPDIETIDTSNPIMAALDGVGYKLSGLDKKPKSNMNDSLYKKSQISLTLIDYNTSQFKNINNI